MAKTTQSKATNEKELKAELVKISKRNPSKTYTYYRTWGAAEIIEHEGKVRTTDGEDCYRAFGGFFKNGKIEKPHSAWLRQFNYIPCRNG
jgi:hypothetical protein